MSIIISLKEARQLAIQSQWLNHASSLPGKEATLETIEHLGYVQIDTLAVVERAHHHTLWSRMPGYKSKWLDDLMNEKKIFEYWGHAASFLPMKDYRFSMIRKRDYTRGKSHWFEQDQQVKRHVLRRIKMEGPLQSKDFETPDNGRKAWYYWKPAKRALEQLFMEGKLMVSHRQGFQKVYDLAANVLPAEVNVNFPTKREYAEHLVRTAIRSHGIVSEREIYYQRGTWSDEVNKALRRLIKEGSIAELKLEGHSQTRFFGDENLPEHLSIHIANQEAHILSPFDNLLIQRKRLQRLFNFDYVIECYVPEAKRKFGYFTLPVLYGDQFIARMDAKADRAFKTFYIRNLWFEPNVKPGEAMLSAFSTKLKAFAGFNGCGKIVIENCNQKKLIAALKKMIK